MLLGQPRGPAELALRGSASSTREAQRLWPPCFAVLRLTGLFLNKPESQAGQGLVVLATPVHVCQLPEAAAPLIQVVVVLVLV